MKRAREAAEATCRTPEGFLQRAIAARSASARARLALQGLATRAPLDPTTQSMLLRQLYLAHFEQRDFDRAQAVAEQMLELGVLPDVCHHDLARALAAADDIDGAAGQLRLAARTAPASRRGFHLWTLGSVLFLGGRLPAAHAALQRALRWSTADRPLVAGQLALVLTALDQPVGDLDELIEQLQEAPCGQGYGRFVLGMLCHLAGRRRDAERHLRAFVTRTRAGRPALAISLAGELEMAEKRLREPDVN